MNRIVIIGNAGVGKSTLAKRISSATKLTHFDLDSIAWDPTNGIDRRPLEASLAEQKKFLLTHAEWIIEGCHMSLVEPVLPYCSELIFLNPGGEQAEANCRARPFEAHKFPSAKAQAENLEALIEWMKTYHEREDEFSLSAHRAVFNAFLGPKQEYTTMKGYPDF